MAKINGLPEYPFVELAHPIGSNSEETLRAKAELAAAALVPLLTMRN